MDLPPRRTARTRTDSNWEKDFKTCEHTAAEWEAHRAEFQKLYLQENLTLPAIRKIMAQGHGFYANKRQFDRKIKDWNFNKNLKRKDAIAMLKIQRQRLDGRGKLTQFKHNGLLVAEEKLQRHASGYTYMPGSSPAATPAHVEYFTPNCAGPATPSDLGTPRNNIGTPMAQDINPETPRPHFTNDEPMSSFDQYMGPYVNYNSSEDIEMLDVGNATPAPGPTPKPPFPIDQIIDSPRYQNTTNTIVPESFGASDNENLSIVNTSPEPAWTSRAPEKTGTKQNSEKTTDNEREDPQRLCQMLHEGNLLEALRLIEGGADLDVVCGCCLDTALNLAIKRNYVVVLIMIDKGVDIEKAGGNNLCTPLHLAAENGHEAVARLLIEKGADVNATNRNSWTPLHWAARNGHEAVARLLIEKGADVNALTKDSWTPLHWAARNGHEAVARLLIEKGANTSPI